MPESCAETVSEPPASEPRPPLEQALDDALNLLVFAPLGLAAIAREQLPSLVNKGREQWSGQATMAKVVGEFAVGQGRREASKLLERATELFDRCAPGRRSPPASGSTPAPSAPPDRAPPVQASRAPSAGPATEPSLAALAIPGYDALSAPQVVSRLDGLSGEELEAVRAYEEATRGRKTILGRVAQLQALLD